MRKFTSNNLDVARSGSAREINRRAVLNLIRKHQPLSRADLSRRSGLQRSTISVITDQLLAEGWLMEGAVGHLPRGRKPTFLHLNPERAAVIGVDIRPVRTSIALAGLDGHFVTQDSFQTSSDPDVSLKELGQRLRDLMKAHPKLAYEGIGVAVPGRVDSASQRLVFAPNLGWSNLEIRERLETATGLPVHLENAANACALAELWSGRHGEGVRDIAAVTVSEGIGVGLIVNGQLVRGPTGLAGEFGHVTLQEDGPLCKCGNRGCWEVCASNTAAVRYYTETVSGNRAGRPPTQVARFEDILRRAEQGDAAAGEALDRVARYLGIGISMLVVGMSPAVIVLFGEVTQAWDRVGPIVKAVMAGRVSPHATTRLIPTDATTQPRIRGTIALVLQRHFGAQPVS